MYSVLHCSLLMGMFVSTKEEKVAMKVNGGKKCEKRQKEKKVTTCGNGIKIHCTRVKHKSTSVLEGECDVCTRLGSSV